MSLPSPLYKERYGASPYNPNNHTINPTQKDTRRLDVKAITRQEGMNRYKSFVSLCLLSSSAYAEPLWTSSWVTPWRVAGRQTPTHTTPHGGCTTPGGRCVQSQCGLRRATWAAGFTSLRTVPSVLSFLRKLWLPFFLALLCSILVLYWFGFPLALF